MSTKIDRDHLEYLIAAVVSQLDDVTLSEVSKQILQNEVTPDGDGDFLISTAILDKNRFLIIGGSMGVH